MPHRAHSLRRWILSPAQAPNLSQSIESWANHGGADAPTLCGCAWSRKVALTFWLLALLVLQLPMRSGDSFEDGFPVAVDGVFLPCPLNWRRSLFSF